MARNIMYFLAYKPIVQLWQKEFDAPLQWPKRYIFGDFVWEIDKTFAAYLCSVKFFLPPSCMMETSHMHNLAQSES